MFPLSFGNKQFTWSSGRNLASITEGTNAYSYAYNKYGYRTSKTVNGLTTDFNVAEDGAIVSQTDGTNTFFFEYSEDNTPLGFVLNNTQYLYITNNSGDVMAIADSTGNILATYSYNEWGVPTVNATGDQNIAIANLNPLRYRGYYYDGETGYYYLQSRYYNPEICRFINADLPEYAKEQKNEAAGINVFVYCGDNPINNSDDSGKSCIDLYLWSVKLSPRLGNGVYYLRWTFSTIIKKYGPIKAIYGHIYCKKTSILHPKVYIDYNINYYSRLGKYYSATGTSNRFPSPPRGTKVRVGWYNLCVWFVSRIISFQNGSSVVKI